MWGDDHPPVSGEKEGTCRERIGGQARGVTIHVVLWE
jgi:hypothetical protein